MHPELSLKVFVNKSFRCFQHSRIVECLTGFFHVFGIVGIANFLNEFAGSIVNHFCGFIAIGIITVGCFLCNNAIIIFHFFYFVFVGIVFIGSLFVFIVFGVVVCFLYFVAVSIILVGFFLRNSAFLVVFGFDDSASIFVELFIAIS